MDKQCHTSYACDFVRYSYVAYLLLRAKQVYAKQVYAKFYDSQSRVEEDVTNKQTHIHISNIRWGNNDNGLYCNFEQIVPSNIPYVLFLWKLSGFRILLKKKKKENHFYKATIYTFFYTTKLANRHAICLMVNSHCSLWTPATVGVSRARCPP